MPSFAKGAHTHDPLPANTYPQPPHKRPRRRHPNEAVRVVRDLRHRVKHVLNAGESAQLRCQQTPHSQIDQKRVVGFRRVQVIVEARAQVAAGRHDLERRRIDMTDSERGPVNGAAERAVALDIRPTRGVRDLGGGLGPGEVFVRDGSTEFHFASLNNLAEGYEIIAQIGDNPALGVVEPGGLLNDGSTTASARRIDMFWGDQSIDSATEDGLKLFDAAIRYALPPPSDGDINDDGQIDLADFNILVSNFNEAVERGTGGDLDLNRRVDLADFVAFRGLFLEANPANMAALPEPNASVLLVTASVVALPQLL